LDDLTRLIKLGDLDGIKLRVMQIYREREELERITQEVESRVIPAMKDAIEGRDRQIREIHNMGMQLQNEAKEQIIGVK
jgi:hypothetical protein